MIAYEAAVGQFPILNGSVRRHRARSRRFPRPGTNRVLAGRKTRQAVLGNTTQGSNRAERNHRSHVPLLLAPHLAAGSAFDGNEASATRRLRASRRGPEGGRLARDRLGSHLQGRQHGTTLRTHQAAVGAGVQRVDQGGVDDGGGLGDGGLMDDGRACAAGSHNGEVHMARRTDIVPKRHERAQVRTKVLRFDIEKDWEARGPARALFEDTSARAIESLHGFDVGRDARVFARLNADGEGEIHIVSADADARAAIKDVVEKARRVHVVEHEIAKPELGAVERVQSAWAGGKMLPPRRDNSARVEDGNEPRIRILASRDHDAEDDEPAPAPRASKPGRTTNRR